MKFDEFANAIVERIEKRLENENPEVDVRISNVKKNNGVELTAVSIRVNGDKISPVIYLYPFYKEFMSGISMDMLVNDILELRDERICEDKDILQKYEPNIYENDKEKVILKLVNKKRNQDTLKDIPYVDFLDMAVVFRKIVNLDEEGLLSVVLSYEDMRKMNVDLAQLYQLALENTRRLFPEIKGNITEIIENIYTDVSKEMKEDIDQIFCEPMKYNPEDQLFVLTNSRGLNGATAILYDGVLSECADMLQDDVYFLPSSIHEFMFLKAGAGYDQDYLKELVSSANATAVSSIDYLSDGVYKYIREDGSIIQV